MSAERKPTAPQLEAMQLIADGKELAEKSRGYRCRMFRRLLDVGFVEHARIGVKLTDAGRAALAAVRGGVF